MSSATIRPWSMIPTRSARASASSRYCVVKKTVIPSSCARRSTSAQGLYGSAGQGRSSARRGRGSAARGRAPKRDPGVASSLPSSRRPGDPQPQRARPGRAAPGRDGAVGPRYPLQRSLEHQMLAAGQDHVKCGLLQCRPDRRAHVRAIADDVIAADARPPARGWQQRRQHQDCRRLPRTVWPEEAINLAGLDRKIYPVDCSRTLLELADEVLDFDRAGAADTGRSLLIRTARSGLERAVRHPGQPCRPDVPGAALGHSRSCANPALRLVAIQVRGPPAACAPGSPPRASPRRRPLVR